jgi:hypothetical protein
MTEPVRVVAHFIDDIVVRGYTSDFNPSNTFFLIHQAIPGSRPEEPLRIELKEIKAVFFVKTLEGNREYQERKEFSEGDRVLGQKVEVTFIDGETIRGYTVDYNPRQQGYFLIPVDPDSNNIQVFVVSHAVSSIRFL